jgi:hypothetical protein
VQRDSLLGEHRQLLAQVLGVEATEDSVSRWQSGTLADEAAEDVPEAE